MTRRRIFHLVLVFLLAVSNLVITAAAPRPSHPRIVALLSTDAAGYREHLERFQDRISAPVEAVVLPADREALAGRLQADPPDLILALGGSAAGWAAKLDPPLPVVFSMVYEPAAEGLPAGPRQCGLALKVSPATTLKALQALRPGERKLRLGALHDQKADGRELAELEGALQTAGYSLIVQEVPAAGQLGESLQSLLPRIDVLWILFEPSLIPGEEELRENVLRPSMDAKVAVIGLSDGHVQIGALMAVSVDFRREGEHAARLAERVLAGEAPAKIGIEPPENVIWSLNLNVAREIGWEVPPLARKRFERIYP